MYSSLKKFYKSKILKIKLSIKEFVKNSIFDFLPSIFSRIILCPLLLLLLIFSCKENPTTPNEPIKPPGYQEDIPWPSLANSPWPRYHGNMQNNGRTTFNGPISGTLIKEIRIPFIGSGIVVGADSNIYLVGAGYLYSLDKDGNENWKIKLTSWEIHNTPVVSSDGTIYIGLFQDKKLVAINPNGTIKWELNTGAIVQLASCIGLDGTIYFIDLDCNLNAVDKNGNILWKFYEYDFCTAGVANSAMSHDGRVIYIITNHKLYAFEVSSQTILWAFEQPISNAALVDSKGNVYLVAKDTNQVDTPIYYYSLYPNGSIRWKYQLYRWFLSRHEATMDLNGNVYFALDTVYSLDYNGNLRWKKYFPNESFPTPFICDGGGKIYTMSRSDVGYTKIIYCFDSDGRVLWSIPYTIQGLIDWSPTIGYDNNLYIPIDSDSSKILIIK
jgi:hypothetical protein